MKTKTIAASALIALLLAVVATAAVASTGHTTNAAVTSHDDQGNDNEHGDMAMAACRNLTAGETLTISGLTGRYANASDHEMHGNASGTLTLKVGTVYAEGCTLPITGGILKLNSTAYTVTGGSIVLNHGGRSGEGTGTTSTGSFLIFVAGLHGNSTSANVGAVRQDLMSGTSQFLVYHHSPGVGDDAGESD